MHIRIPAKRIREKFLIIYELKGAQKAMVFLSKHYKIKPMRIILKGRKVGRNSEAVYVSGRAYFTKKGLRKATILHEFYHHIAAQKSLELSERIEEKEANSFSKQFLKN